MTRWEAEQVVKQCSFRDCEFEVLPEPPELGRYSQEALIGVEYGVPDGLSVKLCFSVVCRDEATLKTGGAHHFWTAIRYCHVTNDEIADGGADVVRLRLFTECEKFMVHEAAELFLADGERIFDPHKASRT